ncbi:hypothetical protein YB2330_004586 [Saitoella coloradoensis]
MDNPNVVRPRPSYPKNYVDQLGTDECAASPAARLQRSMSRNQSFVSLTKSALFGIYEPVDDQVEPPTPAPYQGDNKSYPVEARKVEDALTQSQEANFSWWIFSTRIALIFGLGYGFSALFAGLHSHTDDLPAYLSDFATSPYRSLACGLAAVNFGCLFAAMDYYRSLNGESRSSSEASTPGRRGSLTLDRFRPKAIAGGKVDWTSIMRCIGALMGMGYAASKIQGSVVQISSLLALFCSIVWFVFDRTQDGLLLSSIVAIAGAVYVNTVAPDAFYATGTGMFGSPGWVPASLFSFACTFGIVGRSLLNTLPAPKREKSS